jgi:hypothetical protein
MPGDTGGEIALVRGLGTGVIDDWILVRGWSGVEWSESSPGAAGHSTLPSTNSNVWTWGLPSSARNAAAPSQFSRLTV